MGRNKQKQHKGQQSKTARTTAGKPKNHKGGKPKEEPTKAVTTTAKKDEEVEEEGFPVFERDTGPNDELRFSPYAWAKLIRLRDLGDTEIGGFGLSRMADLLYVEDIKLVKQKASSCTFEFNDEALGEYLFDMLKEGYQPVECMRIWIHTHPGGASPSNTDHETFKKVAGEADWGIMCIVGKDNATSAKLRMTGVGRQYDHTLKVRIDWSGEFKGVTEEDADLWDDEYERCVEKESFMSSSSYSHGSSAGFTASKSRDQYYRDAGMGSGYGYGYGGYEYGDDYYRSWGDDGDRDMPRLQTSAGPKTATHQAAAAVDPEKREKTKLQMIHIIDMDVDDGTKCVWTDNYWFEYDINEELVVEPGDEIQAFNEMAANEPLSWGEVLWSEDDAGNPTYERLSIFEELNHDGTGKFSLMDSADARKPGIDVRTTALSAADPEDEVPTKAPETAKEAALAGKPSSGP